MKTLARLIGILIFALLMAAACLAGPRMGISQVQKDQLKTLTASTRDRANRERDALKRARTDLLQAYSEYSLDEHKSKAARDKISMAQLNLLNIHLDNEIALRGILTSDQFNTFRKIMDRRMREPKMLVLISPEDAVLDRLPDKQMLDALGVLPRDKRRLKPQPEIIKAIQDMRRDGEQMLQLYSNYSLDSVVVRKLIDSIHEKQIALLTLQHQRQQAIRQVLSQDQFQQLQQEIAKRMERRGRRNS